MTSRAGARDTESGPLGERVLGDFVLRELVGAGGFGDVYLAEQQTLRREAVVKVLRASGAGEQGVEEFLREAKLASQLDHPYAAHIYAFGAEPDGVCWIAMELVRGATLRAVLEAQGPMPLERFVPLLERICEVVHTAHEQGIVHRDLKPDNVMVISRAGRLLPKLLDFGIAHAIVEARPSPNESVGVRGSPPYMAPELWIDPHGASRAVDQYALGALAYEALTGRLAFPGRTMHEIARAHARPSRPSLGGELPGALDAVLDRALARRASDRYDERARARAGVSRCVGRRQDGARAAAPRRGAAAALPRARATADRRRRRGVRCREERAPGARGAARAGADRRVVRRAARARVPHPDRQRRGRRLGVDARADRRPAAPRAHARGLDRAREAAHAAVHRRARHVPDPGARAAAPSAGGHRRVRRDPPEHARGVAARHLRGCRGAGDRARAAAGDRAAARLDVPARLPPRRDARRARRGVDGDPRLRSGSCRSRASCRRAASCSRTTAACRCSCCGRCSRWPSRSRGTASSCSCCPGRAGRAPGWSRRRRASSTTTHAVWDWFRDELFEQPDDDEQRPARQSVPRAVVVPGHRRRVVLRSRARGRGDGQPAQARAVRRRRRPVGRRQELVRPRRRRAGARLAGDQHAARAARRSRSSPRSSRAWGSRPATSPARSSRRSPSACAARRPRRRGCCSSSISSRSC